MAQNTGEISASDNGVVIRWVGRSPDSSFVHTHSKVDWEPLHLSIPAGWVLVSYYSHDLQLSQQAGQTTVVDIKYTIADTVSKNNSYSTHSGALAGAFVESGSNILGTGLGTPVSSPEYDVPFVPRVSPVSVELSRENDLNPPEIIAVDLDEKFDLTPSAAPDYEVTCTDPTKWTIFAPNRPASSYAFKYLAHNHNKLINVSNGSQTVPV